LEKTATLIWSKKVKNKEIRSKHRFDRIRGKWSCFYWRNRNSWSVCKL